MTDSNKEKNTPSREAWRVCIGDHELALFFNYKGAAEYLHSVVGPAGGIEKIQIDGSYKYEVDDDKARKLLTKRTESERGSKGNACLDSDDPPPWCDLVDRLKRAEQDIKTRNELLDRVHKAYGFGEVNWHGAVEKIEARIKQLEKELASADSYGEKMYRFVIEEHRSAKRFKETVRELLMGLPDDDSDEPQHRVYSPRSCFRAVLDEHEKVENKVRQLKRDAARLTRHEQCDNIGYREDLHRKDLLKRAKSMLNSAAKRKFYIQDDGIGASLASALGCLAWFIDWAEEVEKVINLPLLSKRKVFTPETG